MKHTEQLLANVQTTSAALQEMMEQVDAIEDLVFPCAVDLARCSAKAAASIMEAGSGSSRHEQWLEGRHGLARRGPTESAKKALFWRSFVTAKCGADTKSCVHIVLDSVSRVESDGRLGFCSISRLDADRATHYKHHLPELRKGS